MPRTYRTTRTTYLINRKYLPMFWYNIANLYFYGKRGVPKNYVKSLRWFEKPVNIEYDYTKEPWYMYVDAAYKAARAKRVYGDSGSKGIITHSQVDCCVEMTQQ